MTKMKISTLYFSATDTTKKVVSGLAEEISRGLDQDITNITTIDFTLPDVRKAAASFTEEDLVVVGVPVYAGRVPNVLLKYLNSIVGNGALAVSVVVYGNRNYDDALIELRDILGSDGFKVIAAGAFIGEHSFSKVLAKDRPDAKDMAIVKEFATQICTKLSKGDISATVAVKGNTPDHRKYYMPKNKDGKPVDMRKITPKTNSEECTDCKICVEVCPMGSIDYDDVSKFNGICIRCGACIKKCPAQARYYDNEDFLWHKHELEIEYTARREPELFIK